MTQPTPSDTPPATHFNPDGQRFFATVYAIDPDFPDTGRVRLQFPRPGYHEYTVHEWLAPKGYQIVATFHGSPNAGDSLKLALDYAAWLNERFPL